MKTLSFPVEVKWEDVLDQACHERRSLDPETAENLLLQIACDDEFMTFVLHLLAKSALDIMVEEIRLRSACPLRSEGEECPEAADLDKEERMKSVESWKYEVGGAEYVVLARFRGGLICYGWDPVGLSQIIRIVPSEGYELSLLAPIPRGFEHKSEQMVSLVPYEPGCSTEELEAQLCEAFRLCISGLFAVPEAVSQRRKVMPDNSLFDLARTLSQVQADAFRAAGLHPKLRRAIEDFLAVYDSTSEFETPQEMEDYLPQAVYLLRRVLNPSAEVSEE